MATIPTRLSGYHAARQRYGARVDRLVPYFSQGDPLADAAAEALARLERAEGSRLVQRAIEGGIDSVPDAPAALAALFRQVEHVPFWVDFERCDRAGQAFFASGPLGGLVLGAGSLARSYCSAGGNKPIAFTGELVDRTPQRLAETGEFVRAVCEREGMHPGGKGWAACVRVRLIHAWVRKSLWNNPAFRVDDWGVPINQADMAATVLLFSTALAEGIRQLGGAYSPSSQEDLEHLWRYAGYVLGVDPELLVATTDEAHRLGDVIEAMDGGPDEDSKRLVWAMISMERLELRFASKPIAHAMYRVHLAICRRLIGDEYADALGFPKGAADFAVGHLALPALSAISHANNLVDRIWPEKAAERAQRGALGWARFVEAIPGQIRFDERGAPS